MVKLSLDNTKQEMAETVWVVLRKWAATCLLNHKECLPQWTWTWTWIVSSATWWCHLKWASQTKICITWTPCRCWCKTRISMVNSSLKAWWTTINSCRVCRISSHITTFSSRCSSRCLHQSASSSPRCRTCRMVHARILIVSWPFIRWISLTR